MTTHIFDSTSVTVRIPNNILDLIDTKANDFGSKGKRSETIINLLKKALDLPVPTFALGVEKTDNTDSQKVFELEQKIEALVESLESVRQENTKLDTAFSAIENNVNEIVAKAVEGFEVRLLALEKNKVSRQLELIKSNDIESTPINLEESTVESNAETLKPHTQAELADRFGAKKYRSQISERKGNLAEWSKSKDPDSIAWGYKPETKLYYPMLSTESRP